MLLVPSRFRTELSKLGGIGGLISRAFAHWTVKCPYKALANAERRGGTCRKTGAFAVTF